MIARQAQEQPDRAGHGKTRRLPLAIGICSTAGLARGLSHLALYFELSAASLEKCIPEIALLDDAVPGADQLLPSVDVFPTRLLDL